jgi:hypothetical protein
MGLVDFWTARKSEVKFLGVQRRKEDGLYLLGGFVARQRLGDASAVLS